MNAVVLDGFAFSGGDINLSPIKSICEVTYYDKTSNEQAIERIADAEIIFTNKVTIDRQIIDSCKNLKYIGVLATGYNVIDTDYAGQKGIVVTNIPDYSTGAVAQHVFGYILNNYSAIEKQNQSVRSGRWAECENFCYFPCNTLEMAGKNIGIIGFGRIGRRVAEIALAFNMNVFVHTPTTRKIEGINFVSLETLLKNSDIISLHCPLFPETERLINADSLAVMKSTAMLINTSRGGLVDEKALADALNSGQIACAAVDVLCEEPPSINNQLLNADNCVITPHTAWSPQQTRQRCIDVAGKNLKAFLDGTPKNTI